MVEGKRMIGARWNVALEKMGMITHISQEQVDLRLLNLVTLSGVLHPSTVCTATRINAVLDSIELFHCDSFQAD